MSRGELARVVGISESYLKKIERGDRSPGLEIYRKITEVLDADISIRNSDFIIDLHLYFEKVTGCVRFFGNGYNSFVRYLYFVEKTCKSGIKSWKTE